MVDGSSNWLPRSFALAFAITTVAGISCAARRPAQTPRGFAPVAATPPVAGCSGRWLGHGQNDGGTPWSIELEVNSEAGDRCGTIEYRTVGCGGHLAHCWRDGAVVSAIEVYTHDNGECAPPGRVDMECSDGEMTWTWRGDEIITARLHRVVSTAGR